MLDQAFGGSARYYVVSCWLSQMLTTDWTPTVSSHQGSPVQLHDQLEEEYKQSFQRSRKQPDALSSVILVLVFVIMFSHNERGGIASWDTQCIWIVGALQHVTILAGSTALSEVHYGKVRGYVLGLGCFFWLLACTMYALRPADRDPAAPQLSRFALLSYIQIAPVHTFYYKLTWSQLASVMWPANLWLDLVHLREGGWSDIICQNAARQTNFAPSHFGGIFSPFIAFMSPLRAPLDVLGPVFQRLQETWLPRLVSGSPSRFCYLHMFNLCWSVAVHGLCIPWQVRRQEAQQKMAFLQSQVGTGALTQDEAAAVEKQWSDKLVPSWLFLPCCAAWHVCFLLLGMKALSSA